MAGHPESSRDVPQGTLNGENRSHVKTAHFQTETLPPREETRPFGFMMIGGAGILALLSASCCVLPIGLSILGLGGAWLGLLGPFVAYRPVILVLVGGVLLWATLRLIRRPPCKGRRTGTFLILGFAVLAFTASATAPLWEGAAQRAMWALWQETRS